jgi:4-oxalocrotonate tautomerase family enzyme
MPTLEVYLPEGHAPARTAKLIAGRTSVQKEALIAALSETGADVLDTPLATARVMIKDIPDTDFGIGGQTAKALGRSRLPLIN